MMVELMFANPPDFDVEAIAERAAERAGTTTEVVGDGGLSTGIAFPEHLVRFDEGSMPVAVWLMQAGAADRRPDWVDSVLQQSWSWDDAADTVAALQHQTLVSDLMAGPLDHRIRLRLFHAVLGATVESSAPGALHWLYGERFTKPADYLADLAEDTVAFESTVNIRYVTIKERPEEQLMDSVGLQPFALPDVQLHYTTLEPGWVAGKLLGVARYLWDNGDVIEDGHTVPGLREDERWPCHHEFALLGPEREVIDIDPSPYGPVRSAG